MRSKFMNLFLGLSLLMVSTWAIPVGQPVQGSAGHVTDANNSECRYLNGLVKFFRGSTLGSQCHRCQHLQEVNVVRKTLQACSRICIHIRVMSPMPCDPPSQQKNSISVRNANGLLGILSVSRSGYILLQSREKGRIGAFQRSSNSWSWAIPTYDKTRLSDSQTVLFIPTKMRRIPIALVLSVYWGPTVNLPKSFSRCCPVKCSSLALAFGMFKIV
ncbi:hypothetical protein C8R42DRAFT_145626 [Lentinula raphanica]|nr:hypothetical protein C8R42DRAFT_145626 [Lentinula raphanica]